MLAHTHIKINTPNGVAYITWNGNDLPSEEQLCFFEKMAEKASKQLERQSIDNSILPSVSLLKEITKQFKK